MKKNIRVSEPSAETQEKIKRREQQLDQSKNMVKLAVEALEEKKGEDIKIIDSPGGAGKRLQPKTRWGVNVCYGKGIVPILTNATVAPSADFTITAPGSKAGG